MQTLWGQIKQVFKIENSGSLKSVELLQRSEEDICRALTQVNAVYPFTSAEVLTMYPVKDYYEEMGETIGHIPYTGTYFSALATFIIRKLFAVNRKPYKVIFVDCDNTLWKGVVAEKGVDGVIIDDEVRNLQQFLVERHDEGMIICLCSKNNPVDVFEVFEKRPEMILKKDHITASRINWELKSQNIIQLAGELNLGYDSFVFIDDNPVECSEVEARCPGVLVLQLPENNTLDFLKHVWAFDKLKVTRDDTIRADFYRNDLQRNELHAKTTNFKDFIEKLELKIIIDPLHAEDVARVSQMTQRVNQFNLKTIRRDEGAVMKLLQEPGIHAYSVFVSDRFGDYGLVGSIIFGVSENALDIDTMLLSCRALGKGVEHEMMASIGHFAHDRKIETVNIEYIPTKRNVPIADFLKNYFQAYGRQDGGAIIYSVPTHTVESIAFHPDETIEKQDFKETENAKTVTGGYGYADIAEIKDIAMNLSSVSAIENKIIAFERKNRGDSAEKGAADRVEITMSDLEKTLIDIWKNVLKRENFSTHDNFFEIGGKSILIPLIVIRLKKEYQISVSIMELFQYPTIASLARYIRGDNDHHNNKAGKEMNRQKEARSLLKTRMKKARDVIRQE